SSHPESCPIREEPPDHPEPWRDEAHGRDEEATAEAPWRERRDRRRVPKRWEGRAGPEPSRLRERAARGERRRLRRTRGTAARARRMGEREQARPQGRRGRDRRVRDTLQPSLLRVRAPQATRRD